MIDFLNTIWHLFICSVAICCFVDEFTNSKNVTVWAFYLLIVYFGMQLFLYSPKWNVFIAYIFIILACIGSIKKRNG